MVDVGVEVTARHVGKFRPRRANAARTAYYRCAKGAPTMSDERLFGA